MTPLPTLGGNNGQAFSINGRDIVVGVAENNMPDATCTPPRVLHFKPVLWEEGEVMELPTIAGDPDGIANAINDKGQAVGQTGSCASLTHGVLWQDGRATDLGTLGGLLLGPLDINNRGQIVGFAFSSDFITLVAFEWQNGVPTNLGTLPPDVFSLALGINDRRQGKSSEIRAMHRFSCRAFLWQDGAMTELNNLVHDPTAPFLENGNGINSHGQIAGKTTVQGTPIADAFLATPCNDEHGEAETCKDQAEGASAASRSSSQHPSMILPDNLRKLLRQRLGYHIPGLGAPRD